MVLPNRYGFLVVILSLLGASTCGCSSKPGGSAAESSGETKKPKPKSQITEATKADFTMDAGAFGDEAKNDPETTRKKYVGKVVELTGVVVFFRLDDGVPLIMLAGKGPNWVKCLTQDEEPWAKVAPGQGLKIKGKAIEVGPQTGAAATAGKFRPGEIVMDECLATGTSPSKVPTRTAEELAKEYATDMKKSASWQEFYLEGTVEKVLSKFLTLKGNDTVAIACFFEGPVESVKVGQKVKLLGKFSPTDDPKKIELTNCLLITK